MNNLCRHTEYSLNDGVDESLLSQMLASEHGSGLNSVQDHFSRLLVLFIGCRVLV